MDRARPPFPDRGSASLLRIPNLGTLDLARGTPLSLLPLPAAPAEVVAVVVVVLVEELLHNRLHLNFGALLVLNIYS